MKLSYLVAACLLACLTSGVASAQTRTFNRDAGFTVGVNVPMYKGVEADATVGFTYGQFYYNGLGFMAGFQYTPSVAEVGICLSDRDQESSGAAGVGAEQCCEFRFLGSLQ